MLGVQKGIPSDGLLALAWRTFSVRNLTVRKEILLRRPRASGRRQRREGDTWTWDLLRGVSVDATCSDR